MQQRPVAWIVHIVLEINMLASVYVYLYGQSQGRLTYFIWWYETWKYELIQTNINLIHSTKRLSSPYETA